MKADYTRGEFLKALGATATMASAGCLTASPNFVVPKGQLIWSSLLHLGGNMWDDFYGNPDSLATSEQARESTNPPPMGPEGKPSRYRNFVFCDETLFKAAVDDLAARHFNMVIIDLGEALVYPSHPELAVPGSWSPDKMRAELRRMRSLGLEPVPKLNFSTCHNGWLKHYRCMISSPTYYQVVADLIRDVCEIFDSPRYFHIGYDEENVPNQKNMFLMVVRQGELWWKDLFYTVNQVEKNGARAMMWADKIWWGREEFLTHMTKNVVMQNWFYRTDFSQADTWDYEKEKKGIWDGPRKGAASFKVLDAAGFDQIPCTSNVYEVGSSDAVVKYCQANISAEHLLGYCTASWHRHHIYGEENRGQRKVLESHRLLQEARQKYYGDI